MGSWEINNTNWWYLFMKNVYKTSPSLCIRLLILVLQISGIKINYLLMKSFIETTSFSKLIKSETKNEINIHYILELFRFVNKIKNIRSHIFSKCKDTYNVVHRLNLYDGKDNNPATYVYSKSVLTFPILLWVLLIAYRAGVDNPQSLCYFCYFWRQNT